jgi:hypothetical protein
MSFQSFGKLEFVNFETSTFGISKKCHCDAIPMTSYKIYLKENNDLLYGSKQANVSFIIFCEFMFNPFHLKLS